MSGNFMGLTNFGSVNDPEILRAMNNGELAEYQRRQGDPTNTRWPYGQSILGMQNSIIARPRKPTMTLAEWDARRAAFRALERVK